MTEARFSISEALKYGWETFKVKPGFFIGLTVITAAATIIPDLIAEQLFAPKSAGLTITQILIRLVGLFIGMITTRISLDIYDTGEADLSHLTDLLPRYLPYLGGKILYGLIVGLGLLALIIPGVILSFMFLYVGYLIIDRGLGPIEALKASKTITSGSKLQLFLFSLVVALLNIGGVICLLVGLVVTIPITLMSSAYVYRQLSPKQTV